MPSPAPSDTAASLPLVLAGPMLRRLEAGRLVLWLVASEPLQLRLALQPEEEAPVSLALEGECCRQLRVGTSAWLHLIDLHLTTATALSKASPSGRRT